MSQHVNAGKDYFIYALTLNSSTDTGFGVTSGYTPSPTTDTPPGYVSQQIMNANSLMIKCRTTVDMQLRKVPNDANYLTIPGGSTFTFDISPGSTQTLFYLRASTGTPVAEILITTE